MQRVMDAIIPRGGAFPLGAADFNLTGRVEEIVQSYHPTISRLFPFILYYIEYSCILRTGRPFSRLTTRDASLFLERMELSPFYHRRMVILMMKLLTCLAFYEIEEVEKQIGYEHGCHWKKQSIKKSKKTPKRR